MEIYLSVGVSTLVALMAAHLTGAGGDRTTPGNRAGSNLPYHV
jgi:hypothetical protein